MYDVVYQWYTICLPFKSNGIPENIECTVGIPNVYHASVSLYIAVYHESIGIPMVYQYVPYRQNGIPMVHKKL